MNLTQLAEKLGRSVSTTHGYKVAGRFVWRMNNGQVECHPNAEKQIRESFEGSWMVGKFELSA